MRIDEQPVGTERRPKRWLGPAYRHICSVAAPLRASQRARRILVALLVAVLAGFPIVAASTGSMAAVLILFVPYIACSLLLAGATGGLFDKPADSLDERQRSLRLSTVPEPYMTGASLGLIAGVTVAAGTRAGDAMMMGLTLLAMLSLYGLPSLILAWRLPDEIEDGD